jgi:hypothetical protein
MLVLQSAPLNIPPPALLPIAPSILLSGLSLALLSISIPPYNIPIIAFGRENVNHLILAKTNKRVLGCNPKMPKANMCRL